MNNNQKFMSLKRMTEQALGGDLKKQEFKELLYSFKDGEMPVTAKVNYCIDNFAEFFNNCVDNLAKESK